MKKLLALVLTLVMTMSLMTVSNAATFDDDASIDYKEAVEVLSAVGILAGDGTGNFNPEGKLDRAAAAKLVTYLMIGADAADGLTATGEKFTDVPASFWGAKYIEYLAAQGVVAGVGDGKFAPTKEVKALEFGKMLLVALGYNAKTEGLVGADWSINTAVLATKNDIFDGNDTYVGSAVATREEAALYVLNTLLCREVYYTNQGTDVVVEGKDTFVSVTTGASSALRGDFLYKELYQGALKVSGTVDAYNYPTNDWRYKATDIGKFSATPVLVLTTEFNANEMLDAVAAAGYAFDIAVNDDGDNSNGYEDTNLTVAYTDGTANILTSAIPTATKAFIDANAKIDFTWSGKGVKVAFFADDNDMIEKIVITNSIVDTIAGKVEDKVSTKTQDERKLITAGGVTIEAKDEVAGFEDIFASVEEDDTVVLVMGKGGAVAKIYVPTVVSGDVSYFKSGSSLTVGGTNYANSKFASISVNGGDEGVTVYLDEFGYAIAAEGGSTTASSLVVLDTYKGLNANGAIVPMMLVLYADGTTARVEAGTMPGFTAATAVVGGEVQCAATLGAAYLYDENDDAQTCLTAVPAASTETTDVPGVLNGDNDGETWAETITVLESAKSIALGNGRNYFAAGAKFIYVAQDAVTGSYKFTVSDKLQALTNVPVAAVIDADGNIATMYILGQAAKNTVKDGSALIFIAKADGTATKNDKDGKPTNLNQYVAFIDGAAVEGFIAKESVGAGFYENEYDSDNGWYVLAGNSYTDLNEDIQVTGAESLTKAAIFSEKYITVDGGVDVELTAATKYASSIDETEISSLAELKAELNDNDPTDLVAPTATIYVVYDAETGVALYVYVTNIVEA